MFDERKYNREYSRKYRAENRNNCRMKQRIYSRAYYQKNKQICNLSSFVSRIKRKYGITLTQRNILIEKQNNRCKICNSLFIRINRPCIDHDHRTNKVRGILCMNCNKVLGLIKDNIQTLANAITYLQSM